MEGGREEGVGGERDGRGWCIHFKKKKKFNKVVMKIQQPSPLTVCLGT